VCDLFDFFSIVFVLVAASRNKKDERFASAWRAACGDEASVGHEWMSEFHGAINRLEDLEPFVEASAAFSNNAISLISATSHVVLDEIVLNYTSKTRFPASKKNAHGPEFFAAAVPAPNAGASAIIWTTPRVWRADQGYSTFEIVDQFITMFLAPFKGHAVADRPVFVADSRFLTPAVVYQLLQTPPMPFVGTINTAWYAAAVGKINELATDILRRVHAADHTGSLTFTAGSKSLYDGHIFSPSHMAEADAAIGDVAATSSSATTKKKARSAPPPPSRKSARTSKRSTRLAHNAECRKGTQRCLFVRTAFRVIYKVLVHMQSKQRECRLMDADIRKLKKKKKKKKPPSTSKSRECHSAATNIYNSIKVLERIL
jgi:hypothetical protein